MGIFKFNSKKEDSEEKKNCCKYCGTKIKSMGVKYCYRCGRPLTPQNKATDEKFKETQPNEKDTGGPMPPLYGCPNPKSIHYKNILDQAKIEVVDYEKKSVE